MSFVVFIASVAMLVGAFASHGRSGELDVLKRRLGV